MRQFFSSIVLVFATSVLMLGAMGAAAAAPSVAYTQLDNIAWDRATY